VAALDLERWVERGRHIEASFGRWKAWKLAATNLIRTLILVAGPAFVSSYLLGVEHRLTPTILLACGVVHPYIRRQITKTSAREMRRRDAEARPDMPPPRVRRAPTDGGPAAEGDGSITTSSVPPR
jgi:hypothetical protein